MDTLIGEWLENEQIGYDIITDEQLDEEGQSLLENYTVVITSSHPEYYSTRMLDAVDAYLDRGGRLMYLGGNGFFWNTPFHQELPGAVECRWEASFGEMFNEFDGTRTGLWWESSRSPESTCGVSTTAIIFNGASAYRRQADAANPRAAFIFDGVQGDVLGDFGIGDKVGAGAVGLEIDGCNYMGPTPRHALVVARCEELHAPVQQIVSSDMPVTCRDIPDPRPHTAYCDMVFFETPNGGAVFSASSIAYVGALRHNGFDNNIAKLTTNVVNRFMEPQPFEMPAEEPLHEVVSATGDDHVRP